MSTENQTEVVSLVHGHSHSHSEFDVPASPKHKKIIWIIVSLVLFSALAVVFFTWPSKSDINETISIVRNTIDFPTNQYPAVVDHTEVKDCVGQEDFEAIDRIQCLIVLFDIPDREVQPLEGQPCKTNQPFGTKPGADLRYCYAQSFDPDSASTPDFNIGDKTVVSYRDSVDIEPQFKFQFADHDRRIILVVLVVLFLLAVVLFGAFRGLLAVAGLIVSILIIGVYILPALIGGGDGLLISLAGGTIVAAAALYLAHGINYSTHIAFLSSIGSVLCIAFIAQTIFMLGNFSGFVSEEANYISVSGIDIDLRGLLIAGVILASLGAMDDMTVTQVAVVSELHNARPDYRFAQLWKSALRIGRDHVAAVVNTLALAYVGTSLALMMIFVVSEQGLMWIANSEAVAVQIVGALVGSIGLIVSVPFSTALSAYVVHKSDETQCHDDEQDPSSLHSSR